jgi:hypothetical protein
MALRYSQTKEELIARLEIIASNGEWLEINPNQIQFRHENGGVMNWYPSTGSLSFQGKPGPCNELRTLVSNLIEAVPLEEGADVRTAETTTQAENASIIDPIRKRGDEVTVFASLEPLQQLITGNSVLGHQYSDSELVIGLVGAVGAELNKVEDIIRDRLKVFRYEVEEIRISRDVIPRTIRGAGIASTDEYSRIRGMMDAGNEARRISNNNAILALGAASVIFEKREQENGHVKSKARRAYIVNSLKHPEEARRLKEIYPQAFFLLGVHSDEKRRHRFLVEDRRISGEKAQELMTRDEDEHVTFGQRVTDTFHMSDFFVRLDGQDDRLKNSLWRILDIIRPSLSHSYI